MGIFSTTTTTRTRTRTRTRTWDQEQMFGIFHLPTLLLQQTITLLYPLYATYKCVAYAESLADLETWLMYWSVYAVLTLLEGTLGVLWTWLPFYYEARLLFSLWLVLPHTRGSTYLYVKHLHPLLEANQDRIDHAVASLKSRARHEASKLLGSWSSFIFNPSETHAQAQHPHPNPQAQAQGQAQAQAQQQANYAGLLGKLAPYASAALFAGQNEAQARRANLERQLHALDDHSGSDTSTTTTTTGGTPTPPSNNSPSAPASASASAARRRVSGRLASMLGESFDILDSPRQ